MLRFLLNLARFVVVVILLRVLIGWVWNLFQARREPHRDLANRDPSRDRQGADVVETARDPVCGAFVSKQGSVKALVAGREHHFCSTSCRDKYLAA